MLEFSAPDENWLKFLVSSCTIKKETSSNIFNPTEDYLGIHFNPDKSIAFFCAQNTTSSLVLERITGSGKGRTAAYREG